MTRRATGCFRRRFQSFLRLSALVAALALFAAACAGGDDEAVEDAASSTDFEESTSTDEAESADAGFDEAMEESAEAFQDDAIDEPESSLADDAPADPLGAGGSAVTQTAADIGRKLIFTADLTVEVDDVAAAGAEATSIIEGLGGFVFGQDTEGGSEPFSRLTFKVLPEDFNTALEALGAVGELRNQTVTTQDVTERIVDLETRIEVAELGVERLRAALEGTQDLEDYAELERLLLERESELEVTRAQLRNLSDQVDLATITLVLTQDRVDNAIAVEIGAYEGHDGGQGCPGDAGEQFRIAAGTEVTVCFDVVNIGDQTLTEITLTDTVLDITENDQLITVFGSIDELAPGQAVLLAFEARPERDLQLRPRVVAVPTDGVSPDPSGPSVNAQRSYSLDTFEPEGDPGFGDGFGAGIGILRALWVAVTVIVGFLIPLLILVPILWLGWMAFGRIRRLLPERKARPQQAVGGAAMPPPPAPTPTPDSGPVQAPAPNPAHRTEADRPGRPPAGERSDPGGTEEAASPEES